MNRQKIKEQLYKTRIANLKETGKRYMTKDQIRESMMAMLAFQVPKEEKNYKEHGTFTMSQLLGQYAPKE
jgi:hypothetical protein